MCGIIGCVGAEDATARVLDGLQNLEYRGYDSAGLAVTEDGELFVYKRAGEISDLIDEFTESVPSNGMSIGHTRWSTHGPPTDANAHPHTDERENIAVVHNGVIANHAELRDRCAEYGYTFTSDTDTEVIAHLIAYSRSQGTSTDDAVCQTLDQLEGSYAVAILCADEDAVYLARQGSPLVLGLDDDIIYFASDVPAFLEYTDEVVYLEDGDALRVTNGSYEFLRYGGETIARPVETVDWDPQDTGKGAYDHYMHKEIHAQPSSLANTIRGRVTPEDPAITFDGFPANAIDDVTEIHLVACGTSYHAAEYARQLFHRRGIKAQAFRGSTYDASVPIDEHTATIAVTQSGETADTLNGLSVAAAQGAYTIAVTNVVGSTAAREADTTFNIRAGPEIGVAATKTFSSQVATLALLGERFAARIPGATPRDDLGAFLDAMEWLPSRIDEVLGESRIDALCRSYYDQEAYFFIGHGLAHPVALEGALKFKEITYKHAEGHVSGELKHGPLALVTSGVPVFAIMTGSNDEQTRINAQEARTRGADVIAIGDDTMDLSFADDVLHIPETHPDLSGLLANVQLQLVAYHSARLLERPIDKPRNLAKSVTVS